MTAHQTDNRGLFAAGSYPSFYTAADADRRACLGTPLEWWFSGDGRGSKPDTSKAKAICKRCPLLIRCRSWALSRPSTEVHGIWGGMTQYEREQHKAKAAPEDCPRCGRKVGRISGQVARHKTFAAGQWVWCE